MLRNMLYPYFVLKKADSKNKKTLKIKFSWRTTTILALLASFFTAIFKAMDNITMHNLIISENRIISAFVYLIIGSWVGIISSLFFIKLLGKKIIDQEFKKIIFKNYKMHVNAFISGTISAGSTLFLLLGNQLGDPTTLIALGNTVVLYTIIYDIALKQIKIDQIFIPTILIVTGGIFSAVGNSFPATFWSFVFVVIISNGLTAISEIVEQKGAQISDSVNLFFWRFVWLGIAGTLLAIIVASIQQNLFLLFYLIFKSLKYIPWITLTMFFVFLGIGLKLSAKKNGSVTIVLLVLCVQMVLGYPITIIGNLLYPGLFGILPQDPRIWFIRIIGMIGIIIGVFVLQIKNRQICRKNLND